MFAVLYVLDMTSRSVATLVWDPVDTLYSITRPSASFTANVFGSVACQRRSSTSELKSGEAKEATSCQYEKLLTNHTRHHNSKRTLPAILGISYNNTFVLLVITTERVRWSAARPIEVALSSKGIWTVLPWSDDFLCKFWLRINRRPW